MIPIFFELVIVLAAFFVLFDWGILAANRNNDVLTH